jgi:putative Ca2+/H+ antiporter (TMEM165/GDT1 family)
MLQTILITTGVVTLAEIGDKTQLLALLLATRFQRPLPIALGILVATLLNHTLAGIVGVWLSNHITPTTMHWILGGGFLAIAIWMLIPDTIDTKHEPLERFGVFGTTLIAFFLAEMGDKTQVATIALAARFDHLVWVVMGTTLGMLIADLPAVWIGNKLADKLPLNIVRITSALLFALLGLAALIEPYLSR